MVCTPLDLQIIFFTWVIVPSRVYSKYSEVAHSWQLAYSHKPAILLRVRMHLHHLYLPFLVGKVTVTKDTSSNL